MSDVPELHPFEQAYLGSPIGTLACHLAILDDLAHKPDSWYGLSDLQVEASVRWCDWADATR